MRHRPVDKAPACEVIVAGGSSANLGLGFATDGRADACEACVGRAGSMSAAGRSASAKVGCSDGGGCANCAGLGRGAGGGASSGAITLSDTPVRCAGEELSAPSKPSSDPSRSGVLRDASSPSRFDPTIPNPCGCPDVCSASPSSLGWSMLSGYDAVVDAAAVSVLPSCVMP